MTEQTNGNGNGGGAHPRIAPFTRLRANVKGPIDDQLAPITAFCGENRTGKTARIDAIRLALTGKHPAGPHGTDLIELVPEGAPGLFCELDGPSGKTSFIVEVEGGKAKKPGVSERSDLLKASIGEKDLEHILPMQSMRTLIDLGSTLGREEIFKRFGSITSVPQPRGLSDGQKGMWTQGLGEVKGEKPKADSAEILSLVGAWMRKKKLALGREITALDKLIKEREGAIAKNTAGAEELPKFQAQLKQAAAWENAGHLRARKAEIEKEVEAYRLRVKPYIEAKENRPAEDTATTEEDTKRQHAIAELKTDIIALKAKSKDELITLKAKAKEELKLLMGGEFLMRCCDNGVAAADAEGKTTCILCGSAGWVPSQTKSANENRVLARAESVKKADEAVTDAERNFETMIMAAENKFEQAQRVYQAWKNENDVRRRRIENEESSIRAEAQRIKTQQEENARALEGVPESYEGPNANDLRAQIKLLEDATTLARQLDNDIARLRELHIQQDMAKVLEQEAMKELQMLLTRTSEAAHSTVNTYMPGGFRAEINLETAKWCVVGRDGRPHGRGIMAGSERGALVPALALGWTEGAPARFVILDDDDLAPFSPVNLRKVFDALKDAIDDGLLTQVFVTSSRPHELPDYVHKVVTDGAQPTAAGPSVTFVPTQNPEPGTTPSELVL
jgi:hypothetical protein